MVNQYEECPMLLVVITERCYFSILKKMVYSKMYLFFLVYSAQGLHLILSVS